MRRLSSLIPSPSPFPYHVLNYPFCLLSGIEMSESLGRLHLKPTWSSRHACYHPGADPPCVPQIFDDMVETQLSQHGIRPHNPFVQHTRLRYLHFRDRLGHLPWKEATISTKTEVFEVVKLTLDFRQLMCYKRMGLPYPTVAWIQRELNYLTAQIAMAGNLVETDLEGMYRPAESQFSTHPLPMPSSTVPTPPKVSTSATLPTPSFTHDQFPPLSGLRTTYVMAPPTSVTSLDLDS